MKLFAFADEACPQIDGQIRAMLRNGLNGLEIRGVDGQSVSSITVDKAAEVREKLDNHGLSVWSVGSPIGKIDVVNDDYAEHLKEFRHTLKIAKILGTKKIRMFSFYMPQDTPCAQYRDTVIARLQRMVEIAASEGIDLYHENEKGIYGDIATRCVELFEAVPGLKGIFDPANFVQCGQDTLEAWELLHPYIQYLHIKDALPDGKVVPAGKGVGNVSYIANSFREQGGDAMTIEPHLTVFSGFDQLEKAGKTGAVDSYVYPSADAAFDAACDALKKLL